MPAISIIIPVYNAERYLQQCIDSVIAQTFKDWEAILVNDGSKDGSLAICQEYASKDDRIKVIDKPNGGPSSARNRGLNEAQGKYVYFMDADDWIETKFFENFVRNAVATKCCCDENEDNDYGYDIIFQGFVREFSNGRKEESFAMDADSSIMSKEEIICRLYKEHVYGWSWCKLFRREIIEKHHVRFDESLRLWEDELFTSEFLRYAENVRTVKSHMYHYICHEESIMHTNDKRYEKVFLSARMNEALMPIANDELKDYINDTYNKELKYSLLMALKNEVYYQCDSSTKDAMLDLYYSRCKSHPEVLGHNIFSNKIAYLIVECILQTRCKNLIKFLLPKI